MHNTKPNTTPELEQTTPPSLVKQSLSNDAAPHGETLPTRRRTRPIEAALLSVGVAILVGMLAIIFVLFTVGMSFRGLFTTPAHNNTPPPNTFAIVNVIGTIQNASGGAFGMNEPSYNHSATIGFIKSLANNEGNKGILLYLNTGGGGVYESDEVYRELMTYREKTGRPIWAYMGASCASGGYYICMAAEKLTASFNTTTGSIGVYISLTDTSGLYDKLGIKTVLVRTGQNKGVGTNGVPITDEQSAVYQSIVNENFDRFVSLVALGRSMPESQVRPLSDGRPFTANQAMQNGLIDELSNWDDALEAFKEYTGAESFTPNFSSRAPIGGLLGQLAAISPQSDTETQLELADTLPNGVPLAWAPGLW